MLTRLRATHSTVVAYLALFVALGGTVYAAGQINGESIRSNSEPGNRIKKRSLPGNRIKTRAITGKEVNGSTLAGIPVTGVKGAARGRVSISTDSRTLSNASNSVPVLALPGIGRLRLLCTNGAATFGWAIDNNSGGDVHFADTVNSSNSTYNGGYSATYSPGPDQNITGLNSMPDGTVVNVDLDLTAGFHKADVSFLAATSTAGGSCFTQTTGIFSPVG